ncbi:hypothetical protein L2E82_19467 [Cichorium intybus]|uniref:Uncharacterized protein n=1 Tax=Cichorium intybus TaxID=13427 RepID=A0ACB9FC60_CICIN|nr:hypothetical protein L2E82_19467 [Cichorium intybus]
MFEADHIDLEDECENDLPDEGARRSKNVQETKDDKPLLHEVDIVGATGTKNAGGAKVKYESLLKKVKLAEQTGVSRSLKNSVINKKQTCNSKKLFEESFGVLERNVVDMKVMKGLCANEKTEPAIAEYLLEAIESIGPNNVLQVVTDNAANCKAAGKEVEKVHKHIFWSPCCVHTLNLIFKDLATEIFS